MVLFLEKEIDLNLFVNLNHKGYDTISFQSILVLEIRVSMLELSIFKSESDYFFGLPICRNRVSLTCLGSVFSFVAEF